MNLLKLIPSSLLTITLAAGTLHAQQAASSPSAGAVDFGDLSSQTLVGKVWASVGAKDYEKALQYIDKCVELYGQSAVDQQKALKDCPTDRSEIFAQWALNDVGVSYMLKGKVLEAQGKKKEALEAYKYLVANLSYAQVWDPQGWFWKPADAAKDRVAALQYDTL